MSDKPSIIDVALAMAKDDPRVERIINKLAECEQAGDTVGVMLYEQALLLPGGVDWAIATLDQIGTAKGIGNR